MTAGACLGGIAVLAVLVSCNQANPSYCDNAVHHRCGLDAGACVSNHDCLAPLGICDRASTDRCVECTTTEHDACTGATPACVDHTCQKCTEHMQCTESNVCLPDGTCADTAEVAYVDGFTFGGACTRLQPCDSLAEALATNRPLVKLAGGLMVETSTTYIRQVVTIFGDPATPLYGSSSTGDVIAIDGGADVHIYDLEISYARGSAISVAAGSNLSLTRVRIQGAGQAAIVASGSTLTLTQSKIDNGGDIGIMISSGRLDLTQSTITSNRGGGIYIKAAEFNITNNVIADNGTPVEMAGAVNVGDITAAGLHTLEFNTISGNEYATGFAAINCTSIAAPLTFSNNIVFGNTDPQVAGTNCAFRYSDIGPAMAAGTGNINTDPMFINPAGADYHLGPSSPAREVADPAATLGVDFDGDPRPQGTRRDMGADEVKP